MYIGCTIHLAKRKCARQCKYKIYVCGKTQKLRKDVKNWGEKEQNCTRQLWL